MPPIPGSTPVLIAGSGPTTLVLALLLAEHGVESLVLGDDRDDALHPPAISLERHALTILRRLGARDLASTAVPWQRTRAYVGSRETVTSHAAAGGAAGLPAVVGIAPARLQHLLIQLLAGTRAVRRPGDRIDDLVRVDESGTATVRTAGPDGDQTVVQARYVVATDDSAAEALGLAPLEATDSSDLRPTGVVVAEVQADLPFPPERLLYVDPPWGPSGRLLLRPQDDTVWQVQWQAAADGAPVASDGPDAAALIDALIGPVVGTTAYELRSARHYPARHGIAAAFRSGSLFRLGAAAHVSTHLGSGSLSSAIQDADNLGWKLAYALRDDADDLLLDSYDAERRPVAETTIATASGTPAAASHRGAPRRPRVGLPGRLRRTAGAREVDMLPLSQPATYRSSPVLQPGAGTLAPELPVRGTDGWSGPLRDLRGASIIVLAIGPTQDEAVALAAEVESALGAQLPDGRGLIDRAGTLPPHRFVGAAAADATDGVDAAGTALGNLLVVRPDGYLAWKVNGEDAPEEVAAALADAMQRAVGR